MVDNIKQELTSFYNEATEDYLFWSKDYNMHFGYHRLFRNNPFNRDSMLNEMNAQIYKRLDPDTKAEFQLADLGCGMGATMKYGLKKYANLEVTGLTLSAFQEAEGNQLLDGCNGKIILENFNQTSFDSNKFDGVIAIESFCHSGHSYRTLEEAHRILKPAHKMVIADAFLKKEKEQLSFTTRFCYKKLCEGWKLEGLGDIKTVEKNLKQIGFRNIVIEDISFRVAPSVMHVPFAITEFILRKKLKRETIKKQSVSNLKGSLYALLSGLHIAAFGYYIITCEKC